MSEPKPEPSVAELAATVAELKLGMKWFLGLFLVVMSLPNFVATLYIPEFHQIFQDALPGKPLPELTLMFIKGYWFFQLMTVFWPIAGLIAIVRGKQVRTWTICGSSIILIIGLQYLLTEHAMYTPFVGMLIGMDDQSQGPH
jgi:hypothetical protein